MSERIVSLDGKMMTKKALLGMKVEESEGCSRARRKGIVSRSLLLAECNAGSGSSAIKHW